jgi:hypothetical protein
MRDAMELRLNHVLDRGCSLQHSRELKHSKILNPTDLKCDKTIRMRGAKLVLHAESPSYPAPLLGHR